MILRPLMFQEGQSLSETFLRVCSGVSVAAGPLSRRLIASLFGAKAESLQNARNLVDFEDKMSGLNF